MISTIRLREFLGEVATCEKNFPLTRTIAASALLLERAISGLDVTIEEVRDQVKKITDRTMESSVLSTTGFVQVEILQD